MAVVRPIVFLISCSLLAPGGVLAFTFYDPYYDRSKSDPNLPSGGAVQHYVVSRPKESGLRPQWYVLIDEKLYAEPGGELSHQTRRGRPLESYLSYFTVEHMKSLFPGATVLEPVSPEWQHCCVIRSSER